MLEINREKLVVVMALEVVGATEILIMRRIVIALQSVLVTVLEDTEVQTIHRGLQERNQHQVLHLPLVEKVFKFV